MEISSYLVDIKTIKSKKNKYQKDSSSESSETTKAPVSSSSSSSNFLRSLSNRRVRDFLKSSKKSTTTTESIVKKSSFSSTTTTSTTATTTSCSSFSSPESRRHRLIEQKDLLTLDYQRDEEILYNNNEKIVDNYERVLLDLLQSQEDDHVDDCIMYEKGQTMQRRKRQQQQQQHMLLHKEELSNQVSNIYVKLMDKSLGWLKRSKSKLSSARKSRTSDKTGETVPKMINTHSVYYQQDFEATHSITAPTMSSSFVDDQQPDYHCHSTPRSNRAAGVILSPIHQTLMGGLSASSSSSSLMSSSSSSSSTRSSTTTSLLSLSNFGGLTSSPKSTNSSTPNLRRLSSNDVLSYIDRVKRRSIRLGAVYNRHSETMSSASSDDEDDDQLCGVPEIDQDCRRVAGRQECIGSVANKGTKKKKSRLQRMFQIKLRKQLNDLKKWQQGVMRDTEDVDDMILNKLHSHKASSPRKRAYNNYNHHGQYNQATSVASHPFQCSCYECFIAFKRFMSTLACVNQTTAVNWNFNHHPGQYCQQTYGCVPSTHPMSTMMMMMMQQNQPTQSASNCGCSNRRNMYY